jgi:hypothetical protein
MPFAGYTDFADCRRKNADKRNPDAYCGAIKHRTEDKARDIISLCDTILKGSARPAQSGFTLRPRQPQIQPQQPPRVMPHQVQGGPARPRSPDIVNPRTMSPGAPTPQYKHPFKNALKALDKIIDRYG